MITILAISLGAFIGAPLRALVEQYASRTRSTLTALLIINSLGSLLAGFSIGAFSGDLRLFLVTGLAGAFTTFSGWALALTNYSSGLIEAGLTHMTRFTRIAAVVIVAIGVAVLAAWVGWLLSQFLI